MRVNTVTSNTKSYYVSDSANTLNKGKKARNISFKNFIKTLYYENKMKKLYNIECDFKTNGFVAECVKKTADIFDDIFGRDSLPQTVDFLSFRKHFDEGEGVLGMHCHSNYTPDNNIYYNSDADCYKTKNKLKFHELTNKLVWWAPTASYLHTFVHEFGHSAHFKHLLARGNGPVMSDLSDTRIPTVIGRFITKFKLGRYAATNMNEFMAERITKDICDNLSSTTEMYDGLYMDMDYAHIFERRWKYRYSSPQAYLDYYTQQVWNGDIEKASEVSEEMGIYLKKIESMEAIPALQTVKVPEVHPVSFLKRVAQKLFKINASLTNTLDNRNNLQLGRV